MSGTEVTFYGKWDGSDFRSGIEKELDEIERLAGKSGESSGDAWSKSASGKVKFADAVDDELKVAEKQASRSGSDAGDAYGKDAGKAAGSQLRSLLPDGWDEGKSPAMKAGGLAGGLYGDEGAAEAARILANEFRAGWDGGQKAAAGAGEAAGTTYGGQSGDAIDSLLGKALVQNWGAGEGAASSGGSSAGTAFASSAGGSLSGDLPSQFTSAFSKGQGIATSAGSDAGEAYGSAAASSIASRKDLFEAVVIQAQKAASDVGLIFNKTDLSFRIPDGGVIPSGVLDQLRQADAQLDNVVTRLGEFSAATGVGRESAEGLEMQFDQLGQRSSILDGIIQGFAFSIANTLTNAAQTAIGFIGQAVGTFSSLDAEIRLAAAAAGEAGAYDRLGAVIGEVGIEAAGSTQDVAALTTELVRGGLTLDEVEGSLGQIVRGAEATGTAYAQMGSVVTATLKGFGYEASEAGRVVDALVQGANSSASSVEGMGYAFKYAAPVAQILGLEVEDVAVAVGLMTNAGIDAAEAGVTLRNGLSKLASAAPETGDGIGKLSGQSQVAADAMKELGVDIYNTDGTLKPMGDTVLALKGAFDQLDPASKIRLASNLFGGEDDGTKWLALLNQSEDEILKMVEAMKSADGATDKSRTAMQGFQLATQELSGTVESLIGQFGGVIASALNPFLEIAITITGALREIPKPIADFVSGLVLLGGALAAAIVAQTAFQAALKTTIVTETISQITTLGAGLLSVASTAIPSAVTAFNSLAVAAATTEVPSLIDLVAGLGKVAIDTGDGISGITKNLGSFGTAIQSAWSSSAAFFAAVGPFAIAVGAVALAVYSWSEVLGEHNKITKELNPEVGKLSAVLEEQGKATDNTTNSILDMIATVTGVKALNAALQDAKNAMALMALAENMNDFQSETAKAQNEAGILVDKIKATPKGQVGELATEVKQVKDQLVAAKADTETYIKNLDAMAAAAKAAGNKELADEYERRSVSLKADLGLTDLRLKQIDDETKKNKQLDDGLKNLGLSSKELTAEREKLAKKDVLNTLSAEISAYDEVAAGISNSEGAQVRLRDTTIDSIEQQLSALGKMLAAQTEKQYQDEENAENIKRYAELQAQYSKEQAQLTEDLIEAERELNQVIADAPVRRLQESLDYGQALSDFASAAADYEEARYSTAKARNEYELKKAEERGASEQEIEAIKREGESIEKEALLSKAAALDTQIAIERQSLELSQEKAKLEADMKVQEQRIELLDQEVAYQQALLTGNPELIELEGKKLQIQQESLGIAIDSYNSVVSLIPLEKQTLDLKQAAAQEGIKAQLAAQGLTYEFKNQITPLQTVGGYLADANVVAKQYADQWIAATDRTLASRSATQDLGASVQQANSEAVRLGTTTGDIQYTIEQAADGSVVLKQKFSDASAAAASVETSAGRISPQIDAATRKAGDLAGKFDQGQAEASQVEQSVGGITDESVRAYSAALGIASGMQETANRAEGIKDPVLNAVAAYNSMLAAQDQNRETTGELVAKANDLAEEYGKVKGGAYAIQDGVKAVNDTLDKTLGIDLLEYFANAAGDGVGKVVMGVGDAIKSVGELMGIDLAGYFGNVASSIWDNVIGAINSAINKAKELASLLFGGGKWMGGDVAAGSSWTVNEFGQESFLSSSGDLSLINRPAYGTWVAPTKGLVIPAGVTSELKAAGAFGSSAPVAAMFGGKLAAAAPSSSVSQHTVNHVTIAAAEPVDAAAKLMMNVARIRARGRRF